MATETTITAGTVDEYINKLSKLGKPVLQARIAKLKAKLKHFAGIAKSGKYAAAGKPGPKNKQHLAGAVRYCQGALSWHESALQKVGTATAAASAPTSKLEGVWGIQSMPMTKKLFDSWLNQQLKNHPVSTGDENTRKILDYLYKVNYEKDKCEGIRKLLLGVLDTAYPSPR